MPEHMNLRAGLAAFEDEVKEIKSRPIIKGGALFYGSSSIRLWGVDRLARHMSPIQTLNHGIGGSTAEQCLYRYPELVKPYNPKLMVWYCGTNDIALGYTPEEAFALSLRVFKWADHDFPGVKLIILSMMHNHSRAHLYDKMLELDALLRQYASTSEGVRHIDLIDPLCHDIRGRIRGEVFMEDQLHLNDKGYEILADLVRPVVVEMMNG
jgi:lysophospholipase L1-like esterase